MVIVRLASPKLNCIFKRFSLKPRCIRWHGNTCTRFLSEIQHFLKFAFSFLDWFTGSSHHVSDLTPQQTVTSTSAQHNDSIVPVRSPVQPGWDFPLLSTTWCPSISEHLFNHSLPGSYRPFKQISPPAHFQVFIQQTLKATVTRQTGSVITKVTR